MEQISWAEFEKVEIRAGTVIEAKVFPEARKPALILKIDFGEEIGIKQSSAQIKDLYTPEQLLGKQLVCVINFPPKQIGPLKSECLVTGLFNKDGHVVLAVPDSKVQNGACLR